MLPSVSTDDEASDIFSFKYACVKKKVERSTLSALTAPPPPLFQPTSHRSSALMDAKAAAAEY